MTEDSSLENGLKSGVIDEEIFNRELALCKKLNIENGGCCGWGSCESCGVIPLLYKIHKGVLLEKPEEIDDAKKKVFGI
jgi:hypothetical protein